MQIPLDYYRILGVPIKATTPQIQQAYEDRDRQRPHPGCSEATVMGRKQLLVQAYQVLIDPHQRSIYDRQFLAATKPVQATDRPATIDLPFASSPAPLVSPTPTSYLEIPPNQLAAALLLLQELGEYELVTKIALDQLKKLEAQSESSEIVREDIVLILALSYYESCRELWQQEKFEAAAAMGRAALDLLQTENCFPQLQAQIDREVQRLLPHRILELVGLPIEKNKLRQQGLKLLQEMIEQRQGIDGRGDDGSGLGIDSFLSFIQKLRPYLTIDEQENLFEREAQRPSAVAAYLAVYAYLANGFIHKQPQKILLAKEQLLKLGRHQDVYVELAVCELLLANPPAAQQAIEQTQEREALDFIEQHSEGSLDLLPGLYVYADGWLQSEVCSQFRDAQNSNTTIRSYFTNRQVQADLETLFAQAQPAASQLEANPVASRSELENSNWQTASAQYRQRTPRHRQANAQSSSGTATLEKALPSARHNRQLSFDEANASNAKPKMAQTIRRIKRKRNHRKSILQPTVLVELGKKVLTQAQGRIGRQHRRHRTGWLIGGGVVLIGLGAVVLGANWLNSHSQTVVVTPTEPELELSLDVPIVNLDELESSQSGSRVTLSNTDALAVVRRWLEAKALAYGIDHQPEQLSQILTEPLRSQQANAARTLERNNAYRQFEHEVTIESVDYDPNQPDRAMITARVREKAQYYQNQQLVPNLSYDENLLVRYQLERQPEGWMIKSIQVL